MFLGFDMDSTTKSILNRFSGANVGDTMDFAKGPWRVVGVFDSAGSAYDSEIWGDVNQIERTFKAQDFRNRRFTTGC